MQARDDCRPKRVAPVHLKPPSPVRGLHAIAPASAGAFFHSRATALNGAAAQSDTAITAPSITATELSWISRAATSLCGCIFFSYLPACPVERFLHVPIRSGFAIHSNLEEGARLWNFVHGRCREE